MDKQIDENDPQEKDQTPEKMVAPEDVTYSKHDEKKTATRKHEPGDDGHINTEDETYLDKKE